MSQAQTIALEVAENAVEFLQYGNQQFQWLAAVMKTIELDAKHNHGRTSTDLASLGHYLSSDTANYLDNQTSELATQLNAAGGGV